LTDRFKNIVKHAGDDFGSGIISNAVDSITGEFGLFKGGDGLRFSFGFSVSL